MPENAVEMSDNLILEIQRIVAQIEGRRQVALSSAAFSFASNTTQPIPSAPSSLSQERQRRRWQGWRGRANSLVSESSGHTSSTNDDGASSIASDPTTLTTPSIASDDVAPTLYSIPCEFGQYWGCADTFHFVSDFVQHSLLHHGPFLPSTSICWFCDERIFHTPSDRTDDRRSVYADRLAHIGDHYRAEDPGKIRPDHFVLSYLQSQLDSHIFENLWNQEPRRVVELDIDLYKAPEHSTGVVVQIAGANGRKRREARARQ